MKKVTTHAGCQNNEQGPTFSNYLPGNEPIPNSSDDEGAHMSPELLPRVKMKQ